MPNDLATLNAALDLQLRDTGDTTWTSAEKDALLTWSCAQLYPAFARPLDPTGATVTLVADTYHYAVPTGVLAASQIDWVDSGDVERGTLQGNLWRLEGDPFGTLKLHVAPVLVDSDPGATLRVLGYGEYDLVTNTPPDISVPLILAQARAEAYRRVAGDRARFQQWQARNQGQNVSVNELLLQINEADAESNRLKRVFRQPQKPVPGRQG